MKAELEYDNVRLLLSETLVRHKEELKKLLVRKSLVKGNFVLSSGKESDYYLDCKLTTLDPLGAVLTGYTVLELLEENGIEADAIGGPIIGAVPIASAVSAISYLRAINEGKGRPLPAFLVRMERKAHGRQKQIEGIDLRSAQKVVVIDEVCTSGASIEVALRAVEERHLEVVAIVNLVDREEGGHIKLRARYGNRYLPVFTAKELLESTAGEPSRVAKTIL